MLTLNVPLSGVRAHLVSSPYDIRDLRFSLLFLYMGYFDGFLESVLFRLIVIFLAFYSLLSVTAALCIFMDSMKNILSVDLSPRVSSQKKICFICPKIALFGILFFSFDVSHAGPELPAFASQILLLELCATMACSTILQEGR